MCVLHIIQYKLKIVINKKQNLFQLFLKWFILLKISKLFTEKNVSLQN